MPGLACGKLRDTAEKALGLSHMTLMAGRGAELFGFVDKLGRLEEELLELRKSSNLEKLSEAQLREFTKRLNDLEARLLAYADRQKVTGKVAKGVGAATVAVELVGDAQSRDIEAARTVFLEAYGPKFHQSSPEKLVFELDKLTADEARGARDTTLAQLLTHSLGGGKNEADFQIKVTRAEFGPRLTGEALLNARVRASVNGETSQPVLRTLTSEGRLSDYALNDKEMAILPGRKYEIEPIRACLESQGA